MAKKNSERRPETDRSAERLPEPSQNPNAIEKKRSERYGILIFGLIVFGLIAILVLSEWLRG